jgi:hypothetical protein
MKRHISLVSALNIALRARSLHPLKQSIERFNI